MNFSEEWESVYRVGAHMSVWPWSDLVSFVHRHAKPADGFRRVLEVGCGAGANIPFFLKLGVDFYGIDGSPEIVGMLHKSFPQLRDNIVLGDFTQSLPFAGQFDLVVDRASIPHNTTAAIQRTFWMIGNQLRPGGKFIGIDWFSTAYPDSQWGVALDSHTRASMPQGQFVGLGAVHFSDKQHILDLLHEAGFQVERLSHKTVETAIPAGATTAGWWSFSAVKP